MNDQTIQDSKQLSLFDPSPPWRVRPVFDVAAVVVAVPRRPAVLRCPLCGGKLAGSAADCPTCGAVLDL